MVEPSNFSEAHGCECLGRGGTHVFSTSAKDNGILPLSEAPNPADSPSPVSREESQQLASLAASLQEVTGTNTTVLLLRCHCGQNREEQVFSFPIRLASQDLRWYFFHKGGEWFKVDFEGNLQRFGEHSQWVQGKIHYHRYQQKQSKSAVQLGNAPQGPSSSATHRSSQRPPAGPLKQRLSPQSLASPLDPIAKLPSEIRDLIFGHYSPPKAVAVDLCIDQSINSLDTGYRAKLPSGRAILTFDGSIASIARRTSAYLRGEYQQALRHTIRKDGTHRVLLLPGALSAEGKNKNTLSQLKPSDDVTVFLLFESIPNRDAFEDTVRACIKDMCEYRGVVDIRAICSNLRVLGSGGLPYSSADMPAFGSDTTQVTLRQYLLQELRYYDSNPRAEAGTDFAKVIEPGGSPVALAYVRRDLSQIICAVLGKHATGAVPVDELLHDHRFGDYVSPAELAVLEERLSPPGQILLTNVILPPQ